MQIPKINNVLELSCFTIMKFRTCDDQTSQFVLIQMEFRFIQLLLFYFMFVITCFLIISTLLRPNILLWFFYFEDFFVF
jgi:hypothetical protein